MRKLHEIRTVTSNIDDTYVALIPPTQVYRITPTGSKKVAAMICIPVLGDLAIDHLLDVSYIVLTVL